VRPLLNALLYFPSRSIVETPAEAGLPFEDLTITTEDGERLGAWWIPARRDPVGHLLLCHGNAGNIGDRVLHARLLCDAGLDVLLFDYRGYGTSTGRPSEEGTYRDARAARTALLARPGVEEARVIFLGESLGGAVALALALEAPPAGLVLQSTFTSIRAMARAHYPFIPGRAVPDAYASLERIPRLACPLLVLHGDRDEIVPLSHGRALFEAAPEPKHMRVFAGLGHNDLVSGAGPEYGATVAAWTP
jgi:fermentation-respiration switch protein FrsA (DUF1100 family)